MKIHPKTHMRQIVMVAAILLATAMAAQAADVGRMSKEELKAKLGEEGLVVVDVRSGRDWKSSEFKIQGAVRQDPGDVSAWAGTYTKDQTLVLYCA
jgi:hypothetical protein